MSLLGTIRQRKAPWTRRVLGMFVVVWLNMALQPCAMAFGDAIDHTCQHCPPAHVEATAAHTGHGADHSNSDTAPCETDASQCTLLEDFNYDGRVNNVKVKDAPSDGPVCIAPSIAVISPGNQLCEISDVGDHSCLPGHQPLLNILYCVFII